MLTRTQQRPRAFGWNAYAISLVLIAGLANGCDSKTDDKKTDDKKADAKKADDKKADDKKADAKKADDKKAEGGAEAAGGDPKEGDSCDGISATDGLIACDGNKVIFCSSYSKYKWTKQNECTDGKKCVAEGKSASCK